MSDAHEIHLVERLGGRRSPGSGNQFNNPMDGRHNRYEDALAFAWDGKSTLGKSISVTQEMWDKACDQALGERPALALRWYHNERLTQYTDLMAVSLDDFTELIDLARKASAYQACIETGHQFSGGFCTRCDHSVDPGEEQV